MPDLQVWFFAFLIFNGIPERHPRKLRSNNGKYNEDSTYYDITACPGSNVKLDLAKFDPAFLIDEELETIWSKDGENLDLTNKNKFVASHVNIFNATVNHAGIYQARVVGIGDYTFRLKIYDSSLYSLNDSLLKAFEGRSVNLQVQAHHHGSAMWIFNGRLLQNLQQSTHYRNAEPEKYGLKNGAVLEITNIQLRHGGIYTLVYDVRGCQSKISIELLVSRKKVADPSLRHRKHLVWLYLVRSSKTIAFITLATVTTLMLSYACLRKLWQTFQRRKHNENNEMEPMSSTMAKSLNSVFEKKKTSPQNNEVAQKEVYIYKPAFFQTPTT